MDWDTPHIRCLVALNELIALDHAVRHRLPKSTPGHRDDFERLVPALEHWGIDLSDPKARLDATIGHLRRAQAEELRILRHNRRNIFVVGFSTFERYLQLRFSGELNLKYQIFVKVEGHLRAKQSKNCYFDSTNFNTSWKRADCYRVARNKIAHQAGYMFRDGLTLDERENIGFLETRREWGIFLEPVRGVAGEEEIFVAENRLSDILSFFQSFALEIDAAVEESGTCSS